jgi:hypothetical protein
MPAVALRTSTLECGMYYSGTELSGSARFPVEFVPVPAIHSDNEVRPGKAAGDYKEKPFHADQHTPVFTERLKAAAGHCVRFPVRALT